MNRKDLLPYFHAVDLDRSEDYNPLQVAESRFFDKPQQVGEKHNYRTQAIQFVTEHKLPFASTCNSIFDLFKQFVKVVCPYCGGKTEVTNGGGAGSTYFVTYCCQNDQCKSKLTFNTEQNGLVANIGDPIINQKKASS